MGGIKALMKCAQRQRREVWRHHEKGLELQEMWNLCSQYENLKTRKRKPLKEEKEGLLCGVVFWEWNKDDVRMVELHVNM